MKAPIPYISLPSLSLAFGLIAIVACVYWKWSLRVRDLVVAAARMLLQLLLVGYVLVYVFEPGRMYLGAVVISVMLISASWIALRPLSLRTPELFFRVLASIFIAGIPTLFIVVVLVLHLEPVYQPHYVIPLAGMIFSNSMNAVSLAAERLDSELRANTSYLEARGRALSTALIPLTNSLYAVGIVSIPGMMTGQILSGVSPLLAARYQIVAMCMVFGAAGIAAAAYISLSKPCIQSNSR